MENKRNKVDFTGCKTLDELVERAYGPTGSPTREKFDSDTKEFCIAQTLKEERMRAGLTQEQLAEMIGTKKTYISRIETGKQNINLNTLFRLFNSLGKKVAITIL